MQPDEIELISRIDEAKDFVTLEDGFQYFWTGKGALSAWMLRAIAAELDKRNEAWNKSIEEYFENHDPPESGERDPFGDG